MPRRLRLRPRDLHRFRWALPARVHKTFPVADILKRLAAPFLVFFLGMFSLPDRLPEGIRHIA